MKRIIALLMVTVMALSFIGCKKEEKNIYPATAGGKNGERNGYNYNMADYVTLGKYMGVTVDKTSETYTNYYDGYYTNLVAMANAYNYVKEGVLKKEDTAMIEYVGRIDGKEFQGGTSEEEMALTLGSGAFIAGFEDALIGATIGKEKVINIKFPDDYDQTAYFKDDADQKNGFNLKGKPVEFTVKVNSIRILPEKNDETAKKLGLENAEKLIKNLENMAIEQTINYTIINAKDFAVKSYPEAEKAKYDKMYNDIYTSAQQEATAYNAQYETEIDANTMIYYMYGTTAENIKAQFQNTLKNETIFYAIFDDAKLSYTEEEYNAFLAEIAAENSNSTQKFTVEDVKANYEPWQLETLMITDVVLKHLAANAEIK